MNSTRRRMLLSSLGTLGLAGLPCAQTLHAAALALTPSQSRGPFYPAQIPLDSDNDLIHVDGQSGVATGTISHVMGRVLDDRGRAVSDALVEIWQCDRNGRYHHPWDQRDAARDPNFQGYGRFRTGGDGRYRFTTIKPVPYPGRTPHIHFAISGQGIDTLVTQMYVSGEPQNARDGVLNHIEDAKARQRLMAEFNPSADVEGELSASFDIVLVADGRFGT